MHHSASSQRRLAGMGLARSLTLCFFVCGSEDHAVSHRCSDKDGSLRSAGCTGDPSSFPPSLPSLAPPTHAMLPAGVLYY